MHCTTCDKPQVTITAEDASGYCSIDCAKGQYRSLKRSYGAFCYFYGGEAVKARLEALIKLLKPEDREELVPTVTCQCGKPAPIRLKFSTAAEVIHKDACGEHYGDIAIAYLNKGWTVQLTTLPSNRT
jgi:hypothetical protein